VISFVLTLILKLILEIFILDVILPLRRYNAIKTTITIEMITYLCFIGACIVIVKLAELKNKTKILQNKSD